MRIPGTQTGKAIIHIGDDEMTVNFNLDWGEPRSANNPLGAPIEVEVTEVKMGSFVYPDIETAMAEQMKRWVDDDTVELGFREWKPLEKLEPIKATVDKLTCPESQEVA